MQCSVTLLLLLLLLQPLAPAYACPGAVAVASLCWCTGTVNKAC
jgi:hypothetical protein